MKLFDKLFKKNKISYKISQSQENNLVIILSPKKDVKLNSKIIIPENFNVVVFTKEKLLDIIPSGEYELNALIILKTCKANKLDKPTKKGYKTKFFADFYYVNLNVCKIYNKFDIKRLKTNIEFSLQFKINDPKKFLKFLVNEKVVFDDKFASHFLNFSVSQLIYYYFLDNKVVTNENLSNYIKNKLISIGIDLLDFVFKTDFNEKTKTQAEVIEKQNIKFNNENKKNEIKNSVLIDKFQDNYKNNNNTQSKIESVNEIKSNSEFQFKPFNNLINLDEIQSENITYFICDNCGARLSKDSKICYNCKKCFTPKNCCEYCGKEIEKGIFVCPHCNSVLIGN